MASRGCFFVLEGLDRVGKSTQVDMLAQQLKKAFKANVKQMKFPERSSQTGQMINRYLAEGLAMDDRAIHLLFSANRWECRQDMEALLTSGSHIVVDRYAYSGVAYSAAKQVAGMDREWCAAVDRGLLAPDAVIYLDLNPDSAEARGGYGEERYEKVEFQKRVRAEFQALQDGRFAVINASQPIESVHEDIWGVASAVVQRCQKEQWPLGTLWDAPLVPVDQLGKC